MTMASILIWFLCLTWTTHGYYLSPITLKYDYAELYCDIHCNSDLSSIHSDQGNKQIIQLIKNSRIIVPSSPNVRFGLNDIDNESIYTYPDGTIYDYPIAYKSYPWYRYDYNDMYQNCVEIVVDANYTWETEGCAENLRFICNDCSGVLNKYIAVTNPNITGVGYMNYSQTQSFCKNTIGTSLASLHSDEDFKAVRNLCIWKNAGSSMPCWIGLDDLNGIGNFTWKDGTYFDYATNLSGVYPWDYDEPDVELDDERCVQLRQPTYLLWDVVCRVDTYAICNMPSELCMSEWLMIDGSWSLKGNCEMETVDMNAIAIINDKTWSDQDVLVIEYMVQITDVVDYGHAGIMIDFKNVCTYYYIGISINKHSILFGKKKDEQYIDLMSVTFDYSYNVFYQLRIVITNGSKYDVYINNMQQFVWIDDDTDDTFSGDIGIYNVNASVHAKSLFVSGTPRYLKEYEIKSVDELKRCLKISTVLYGVIIRVKFEYEIIGSKNMTFTSIASILSNITNTLIMNELDGTCTESDDYGTTVKQVGVIAIINATIIACDQTVQNQLKVSFEQDLQSDFIKKLDDYNLIAIVNNSIKIDIAIINISNYMNITQTFNTTEFIKDIPLDEADGTFWIFAIVMMIIISVCVIILCVIIVHRYRKNETASDEVEMNAKQRSTKIDNNSPLPRMSVEDDVDAGKVEDQFDINTQHHYPTPMDESIHNGNNKQTYYVESDIPKQQSQDVDDLLNEGNVVHTTHITKGGSDFEIRDEREYDIIQTAK